AKLPGFLYNSQRLDSLSQPSSKSGLGLTLRIGREILKGRMQVNREVGSPGFQGCDAGGKRVVFLVHSIFPSSPAGCVVPLESLDVREAPDRNDTCRARRFT